MAGERATWCTFRIAGHLFGLEISRVQEVLRAATITPVPLAPAPVRGLINLRSRIVTVLDLRDRLGLPAPPSAASLPHVVVSRGSEIVTLLVDSVEDVLRTGDEAMEPCPGTLQGLAAELIRGCCRLDRELMLVLDLDRALEVEPA